MERKKLSLNFIRPDPDLVYFGGRIRVNSTRIRNPGQSDVAIDRRPLIRTGNREENYIIAQIRLGQG